ncbi:MAG TPA: VIT1/CCC1 transporter family protein [Mycobacteriales bacterium]|jgi:VIT1/CCC1 family predicted Fe2+/Mn2+ transporter|nr:VIT1/CCC1 transporter family protein [Mycobacteriales bacterium]
MSAPITGSRDRRPEDGPAEGSYRLEDHHDQDGHDHGHQHRDVTGGWLRPAVFGAMDGLITNVSLIAGIGGAGAHPHTIVLTGMAGLVAGAFSMATGEYTSVQSQNESVRAEVAIEKLELKRHPAAEVAELAASFRAKGVDEPTARRVAEQLSVDPEVALRTHAQEELGVDPHGLPSPWTAAGSSFLAFTLGAVLPLLTFLVGVNSLPISFGIAAVALFAAGVLTAQFTGRHWLFSGLRQLALGALAAGVTYWVGHAIGAQVA